MTLLREKKEGISGGRCLFLLQFHLGWLSPGPGAAARSLEGEGADNSGHPGSAEAKAKGKAEAEAGPGGESCHHGCNRRGEGMQTGSLPLIPWVQVRLGVPSCPGHPVAETAIQRGYGCEMVLWGAGAEGLLEVSA